MDGSHFDDLVRDWLASGTRRSLVQRLSALPLVGGLALFFEYDEESEAKRRKNRRKARHRHRPGNHKHNHKKHKKKCKSQAKATTCAGKCGSVTNNCKQTVDCGSCACDPPCDACFTCQDGPTTPGACIVDPEQQGDPCGETGQVCQADGACACDADSCPVNASCVGGICECDSGFELCGDACVDTDTDPANCGECGNVCPGGGECNAGICECPAGQKNCNGTCIDQAACCGVCVQLTWDTPASDLDSHAWAPDGTEVWYQNTGSVDSPPFMALDVDDTQPPGAEQISIAQLQTGTTSYAVVNFDECEGGGTDFATGNAEVHVTRDGTDLGTFLLSDATGSGVWWNVFAIDDHGVITEVNELSDTPLQPSGQTCN